VNRTTTLYRARRPIARPPAMQSSSALDSEALATILGLSVDSSSVAVPVNETTVRGLTGAWAAVNKIANNVGQMMSAAGVIAPGGAALNPPAVVTDPCVLYDPFVYWSEVVTTGLPRGNWIGIKADFDAAGYPRQVVPVPIDAVHAHYVDGLPVYQIGGDVYLPDEIVHIKLGWSVPGQIMAVGAIEAHRTGLAGQLSLNRMAASVWREGAVPSGIVQMDKPNPTVDEATTVKTNWIGIHGGRRTVGVIGKAMTYVPVTWSAQDAQWLESRQFSIAECALMFGLRPEDLGSSFGASSGAMSYGNRTDDALQRITDAYMPVMLPIEQAWSRLIPGRPFVQGNPEALMRSTPTEQVQLTILRQQAGLETPDESRALAGKGPKPPDPIVTETETNPTEEDANQ
jgi:hypothetical protein